MKGKLIVIEGSDGSGKATQSSRLLRKLRYKGFSTARFAFPQYGKNIFANMVGDYLRGEFGENLNPHLAAILYAGDRFKAAPRIRLALSQGRIAVSDRYAASNKAHQAARMPEELREEFLSWLDKLEFEEFGIPRPDLTVFLQVDPKISYELIEKKAQRAYTKGLKRDIHEANRNHLEAASQCYALLSKQEDWATVDCTDYSKRDILPIREVARMVWQFVEPVL